MIVCVFHIIKKKKKTILVPPTLSLISSSLHHLKIQSIRDQVLITPAITMFLVNPVSTIGYISPSNYEEERTIKSEIAYSTCPRH